MAARAGDTAPRVALAAAIAASADRAKKVALA